MVGYELKQQLKLTQQLVLTPQLQLAIKLLQLPRLELIEMIQQELTENPVLEDIRGTAEDEPVREEAGAEDVAKENQISETEVKGAEEIDWERYLENAANPPPSPSSRPSRDEELPGVEATATRAATLYEHLMWQVRMSVLDETQERVASVIAGNLDDKGYLKDVSVAQIASDAGVEESVVEHVLKVVQMLDPVGVAARNLEECLLVQARVFGLGETVEKIIEKHLPNLQKKNLTAIARDLRISFEDVVEAARLITGLEPRPARNFTLDTPQYIVPDVYVYKDGEGYRVVTNDDGLPKLKVSNAYRRFLKADTTTKEYVKGKLKSAQWLIKSIEQRRRTIIRVTECIVEKQSDFIDKGARFLKPMVLDDVARALDLHPSTVSRVTSGKYVHTPQGLYELKYFFNTGIRRMADEDMASEVVKGRIKELIEAESHTNPYSDQQIVNLLARDGIVIARRTIAKYREGMNILPSSQRKQPY
jgi:RNA polymerase sigma-54 factor